MWLVASIPYKRHLIEQQIQTLEHLQSIASSDASYDDPSIRTFHDTKRLKLLDEAARCWILACHSSIRPLGGGGGNGLVWPLGSYGGTGGAEGRSLPNFPGDQASARQRPINLCKTIVLVTKLRSLVQGEKTGISRCQQWKPFARYGYIPFNQRQLGDQDRRANRRTARTVSSPS